MNDLYMDLIYKSIKIFQDGNGLKKCLTGSVGNRNEYEISKIKPKNVLSQQLKWTLAF